MNVPSQQGHSHLFTIRVWKEEIGANTSELRGKVQLVNSGEVRYFREWDALAPLLLTMLSESDSALEIQQQNLPQS